MEDKRIPLWRREIPDAQRLQIINPDDFPRDEILKSLGIADGAFSRSFGITDLDEIRTRQGLCDIMLRDPEFRQALLDWRPTASSPTRGEDFLSYHDPQKAHTPYWTSVHRLLNNVSDKDLPERLRLRINHLREGLPLEQREREMTAEIARRLETITVFEGLLEFSISGFDEIWTRGEEGSEGFYQYTIDSLELVDARLFGHSEFSQALTRSKAHELPRYARNPWNPFGWPARMHQSYLDWVVRRRAYQNMVITSTSDELVEEVTEGVLGTLKTLKLKDRGLDGARVSVYVFYSKDGLEIQFLNIGTPKEKLDPDFEYRTAAEFPGYSSQQVKQIRNARQQYADARAAIRHELSSQKWRECLEAELPGIFRKLVRVVSPRTDQRYRWFAIENLYRSPRWSALAKELFEHRNAFEDLNLELKEIARLIDHLQAKADEFGVPLTAPEVVDGDHVVAFEGLFPTQLLFRMKPGEVVPLNGIPELNGSFIGLTGKHGGGKTETLVTIATNIYLAQSGLPVFASSFRFNVKRALGLAFIPQRGVGSTIQQMTEKLRLILEGIHGIPGHEVVVLLDEIGTGTQTQSGIMLGRRLLARLHDIGCSVIYSSQFHEIATYAANQLGAKNFQFDRKHRIQPGIGDGGLDEHLKESGLEELLQTK